MILELAKFILSAAALWILREACRTVLRSAPALRSTVRRAFSEHPERSGGQADCSLDANLKDIIAITRLSCQRSLAGSYGTVALVSPIYGTLLCSPEALAPGGSVLQAPTSGGRPSDIAQTCGRSEFARPLLSLSLTIRVNDRSERQSL